MALNHNTTTIATSNQDKNTSTNSHYLNIEFDDLRTKYDPEYRALFCILKSSVTPVFTLNLLKNIRKLQDDIAQYCNEFPLKKPMYIIWMSDRQDIFSLGIDLKYIYELIINRDQEKLYDYMELCIDLLYINIKKLDIDPLISISLIHGKTFGAGFEAALTSDLIFAGKNVRCALPGVTYNLLPSIGLMKLILRRFPRTLIESLLFNGKYIDAQMLKKYKLIEDVVNDDSSENTIIETIKTFHHKHSIYSTLYNSISSEYIPQQHELESFKNMWIDRALQLSPNDIIKLCRIAEAQQILINRMKPKS